MTQSMPLLILFQSTLPVGGATFDKAPMLPEAIISIHAPRGGSDENVYNIIDSRYNFNPRSPWGERQQGMDERILDKEFQSTLPVGGATTDGEGKVHKVT